MLPGGRGAKCADSGLGLGLGLGFESCLWPQLCALGKWLHLPVCEMGLTVPTSWGRWGWGERARGRPWHIRPQLSLPRRLSTRLSSSSSFSLWSRRRPLSASGLAEGTACEGRQTTSISSVSLWFDYGSQTTVGLEPEGASYRALHCCVLFKSECFADLNFWGVGSRSLCKMPLPWLAKSGHMTHERGKTRKVWLMKNTMVEWLPWCVSTEHRAPGFPRSWADHVVLHTDSDLNSGTGSQRREGSWLHRAGVGVGAGC